MNNEQVSVIVYSDMHIDLEDNAVDVTAARNLIAEYHPEVRNAVANIKTLDDGRLQVTFVKKAGDNG